MMGFAFAGLAVSGALMAALVPQMRRAILALWVTGLGVSAIFLSLGAEFLAIIQCIVSTLVAISLVFFAVMFGEYQHTPSEEKKDEWLLRTLLAATIGGCFSLILWLASTGLVPVEQGVLSGNELMMLGKSLTQDHLLSVEVLALVLFLVLVGAGVVARIERNDPS